MSSYRIALLRVLHGLALVFLIVSGSFGSVTAVGTAQDEYCVSVARQLPEVEKRLSEAASSQRSMLENSATVVDIALRQYQTDETSLHRAIDEARASNLAQLPGRHTQYSQSIKDLTAQRRQVVKQANQQFAIGVRQAVNAHQAALSGQVEAYRIAVTDALQAADITCKQTDDGTVGKPVLIKALKQAHDTYASQHRSTADVQSAIQRLAAARTSTVSKANQTFLLATTQARGELQATVN